MKRILMSVSSLLLLSDNVFSKNIQSGQKIVDKGILSLNSNVVLKNTQQSMSATNILKAKKFLELFKGNYSKENLTNYSLTSMSVVETKGYKNLEYILENGFQKIVLQFPVQFNNNQIEEIYPSFYEAKSKKMLEYKTLYMNKDILKNRFEDIFLCNGVIKLNENKFDNTSFWILIESENDTAYSFIRGMYDGDSIKPEYADKNINLVVIPSNYFDTNYSLEISALFKHYDSGKDFLTYLLDKQELVENIEDKYFKKFKDGYASDFVIDMYKELNDGKKILTEEVISRTLKKVNQDTDFVSMLKLEENYIVKILENNAFSGDIKIYKSYEMSNKFKYVDSIKY